MNYQKLTPPGRPGLAKPDGVAPYPFLKAVIVHDLEAFVHIANL